MPKKILRLSIDGTPHDATPSDWRASDPLIVAGSPHDAAPTGTLLLGLGANFRRKVAVRTNPAGELFLEFDI